MAKLTLDMLVYSEAEADRMVTINGRKYVKGDAVEGRYLVEEITREGVTLSYRGEKAVLRP
ncbi:MAG TPA: general secretion pathway protein GspB [Candidatus Baltobacteraceae bacterium]|nr:general secretion pathway protein GspB [Candidatus Baltobacteraceae bacterium]